MDKSSFQFNTPQLGGFSFNPINPPEDGVKKLKYKLGTSVNIGREEKENKAVVEVVMSVEASSKEGDTKYYDLEAKMFSFFKWDDTINGDMVDVLLSQNAPSLIIAYIRPIIAQITVNSPYERLDLPFFDFTKTGHELNQ